MRMSYSNQNEEKPKAIIFDWDDTILPSTFVDQHKVEKFTDFPLETQRILHEVARSAERCLNEASKYGEVLIITNSDDGWVNYSCERYCPKLLSVMKKYKIVSARTRYERFYPGQPLCWKAAAFAHEVNELYQSKLGVTSKSIKQSESVGSLDSTDISSASEDDVSDAGEEVRQNQVISFGDSMEERTAVRIVAQQLEAIPKSVMFIQAPTPKQIIGQLEMLVGHMKYVCEQKTNLDLEISMEQADRSADHYLKRMLPVLGSEHDEVRMMIQRHNEDVNMEGVMVTASSIC